MVKFKTFLLTFCCYNKSYQEETRDNKEKLVVVYPVALYAVNLV